MAKLLDNSALLQFLFATNALKVLALFLRRPTAQLYGNEVMHLTGLSRAGVNFALRDLAKTKLLTHEKRGKMHFYRLIDNQPIVRQLKLIMTIALLAPLIDDLKMHTRRVILYGSAARGEDHEESDIDLLIVTREKKIVENQLRKYSLPQKFQIIMHTSQEWTKIETENNVFADQVEKGLLLWEAHES